MENVLAGAIAEMLSIVRHNPDFDDPGAEKIASIFTWQHVFEKVRSVYMAAIGEHVKG